MASVNDYGKDELANLAAPKLGGTDGWAAAVAAVVNESDVTVDQRIYDAIASSPRGSRWLWGGQDADVEPLPGRIAVESTGGQNRKFAMSNTDADGYGRSAAALIPGDTITVTDDPESPPITGFARYVIIDDPVEHGTYWTWNALRTDTSGSQSPPAIGTSVRMNATWSGSAGDLYVKKSGDTMVGNLTIDSTTFAELIVDSGSDADTSGIRIKQGGVNKWLLSADSANRLALARYDKTSGAWQETALNVSGDTGLLSVKGDPTAALGVATKQYVDAVGIWQAWTPVIKKGATTMPVSNYSSRYCRIGNTVFVELITVFTTANSTGDALTVVPPVPITSGKGGGFACGVGTIVTPYVPVHFYRQAAAGTDFIVQNHTTGANYGTAIDANDSLRGSWSYEV